MLLKVLWLAYILLGATTLAGEKGCRTIKKSNIQCKFWDLSTGSKQVRVAASKLSRSITCNSLIIPCCEEGRVCDEYLGCFEQGANTPWCHQVSIPQCPEDIKPEFWIYSYDGKVQTVDYKKLEESISQLNIDVTRELWILIHGFGGEWPKRWIPAMTDALNAKGHNVLICRWTSGSKAPIYWRATANTRMVGAIVARVAKTMLSAKKLDLTTTTILGFSLGAHVAGFAGSYLPGLHKIIGLDPAGPLFGNCGPTTRLNYTNARFVMTIHCNGESIWDGGCGTMEPMGHIDFYSNGGKVQVGCKPGIPQAGHDIALLNFTRIFGDLACSHLRCPWLFTSSILLASDSANAKPEHGRERSCKFKGYPCKSADDWLGGKCFKCEPKLGCPVPGYETTYNTPFQGTYYFGSLCTNATDGGFCGHTFIVTLQAGSPANGQLTVQLTGESFRSEAVEVLNGLINKGKDISSVFVGPWQSDFPVEIAVTYKYYSAPMHFKIYESFTVSSIRVQRDDGMLYNSDRTTTVDNGKTIAIRLVQERNSDLPQKS